MAAPFHFATEVLKLEDLVRPLLLGQIDGWIIRLAWRRGGVAAIGKVLALKKELEEWHNQPGSQVKEDEKGCFGGAWNAWYRATPKPICLDSSPLCERMQKENVNAFLLESLLRPEAEERMDI
jgi:hypothetical protein